jgi:acyl-CoA synthetase (AMP-forming)/AMP-acid ligase II
MDEARRAAGSSVPLLVADINASGEVELTGGPASTGRYDAPTADDIALILHTSGSTGRPKRVPLTHAQLSIAAVNVADTYALTPDDVSLCVMPLFHVHGLVASTLGTLATGGTVIVPAKFNPLSHWRVAESYGATWYSAVPTMHQLLVARAKGNARPAGAGKLRFIRSCSASLAPQLLSDLEECFGAPVLEAYGMTEAAHQMASNPLPPKAHKPSSVGPNTGTTEIAIMDAAGNLLQSGERGEVVIRGANVIKGYENNPEANASSFTNGWFRTGDQGYLDEDGYLLLTGRLKEMINRGGEKIAPREIDEALLSHPAVDQAVAFGVPHPGWGEEVAAAVVLKEGATATEAELTAHCRERLADFKRPKQIFITQAIPRTATGKIQRSRVAEAFAGAAAQ